MSYASAKSKCSAEAKLKMQGGVFFNFIIIIIIIISAKSLLTRRLIKGDRPNIADLGLGVMTDLSKGLCTKWLPIKWDSVEPAGSHFETTSFSIPKC